MPEQSMTKVVEDKVKPLNLDLGQVTKTESIFNRNQVQGIFNSTPKRYRYNRPAKGGGEWEYTTVGFVRQRLNAIFGFNWDFQVETTLSEAFEVARTTKSCVVKGLLTGRTKHNGEWVSLTKTQFGRSDVKFKRGADGKPSDQPMDFGNDMKAASSDALKKCASLFGIAADVYERDEFMDIKITGSDSDDEEEKEKIRQKRIKKAKKQVDKQAKEASNG